MAQEDPLDYEAMVQIALREVVYKTMSYTVKNGLPGDHHYYITFATEHPGVETGAKKQRWLRKNKQLGPDARSNGSGSTDGAERTPN